MAHNDLLMVSLAEASAAKRSAIAEVDRGLQDGSITLAQALTDHRKAIGHRLVFEVLLKARGISRKNLPQISEPAMRVGINLAQPVNACSAREILWLCQHIHAAAPTATKARTRTGNDNVIALAA